jgi:hypothetical protein
VPDAVLADERAMVSGITLVSNQARGGWCAPAPQDEGIKYLPHNEKPSHLAEIFLVIWWHGF